jgi:hypothetical protein
MDEGVAVADVELVTDVPLLLLLWLAVVLVDRLEIASIKQLATPVPLGSGFVIQRATLW